MPTEAQETIQSFITKIAIWRIDNQLNTHSRVKCVKKDEHSVRKRETY